MLDGRECPLPEPLDYRDFLTWLEGREPLPAVEAHWRDTMSGFEEVTRLATDRGAERTSAAVRPPESTYRTVRGRLDAEMTGALSDLARNVGVTFNTLVQGAWALLLGRYSGGRDVVFAVPRACRHSHVPGAEGVVGLFLNTLPLRIQMPPEARLGAGCPASGDRIWLCGPSSTRR